MTTVNQPILNEITKHQRKIQYHKKMITTLSKQLDSKPIFEQYKIFLDWSNICETQFNNIHSAYDDYVFFLKARGYLINDFRHFNKMFRMKFKRFTYRSADKILKEYRHTERQITKDIKQIDTDFDTVLNSIL